MKFHKCKDTFSLVDVRLIFCKKNSDHSSLVTREELFCAANVLTHLGAGYINDQNYGAPERVL